METIEQLRSDPRPLVSLGNISAVTGEPLGEILLQLADKNIPLYLTRPKEVRVFCVAPWQSLPWREETYQEAITNTHAFHSSTGPLKPTRHDNYVEAPQLSYLVLTKSDYSPLVERNSGISAKLFIEAAYIDSPRNEPIIVSASSYYSEHFPQAQSFKSMKASFVCFSKNEEWPSALIKTSIEIKPEELLISRRYLTNHIKADQKPNTALPLELQEHLQPWKSNLLISLNIAAFKLYSKNAKDKNISNDEVKATITEQINDSRPAETTLDRLPTILRHDRQPRNFKSPANSKTIHKYPDYFSLRLIYLNEMCKHYYEAYNRVEPQKLPTATSVQHDLQEDGILNKDTARRIASDIIPILRNSTL